LIFCWDKDRLGVQKDLVIGVDSSTTAVKAIAWDKQGKLVAQSRASFEMISPQPNWYEQRAEDWWTSLCDVLRSLTAQVGADRVAAISITNQRETFVPVDENCQPIRNAILWLDDRSRLQVDELDKRIGSDKIQDITGKGPSTKQALPKLIWLQQHEPAVMRRAFKFVESHAFLMYRLSGRWVTSTACADPLGLVDMRRGEWATDLMRELGLNPEQFVTIMPPGSVVGEVTDKAAEATGLLIGTPIVAGAGDGQSAGLGANITSPGKAYLNLGTAMVSGAHTDNYVASKYFRTMCSPLAGAFVAEEVLGGGTFIVNWFVEQFGPDVGNLKLPLTAEELLEVAASKLPPGALGLMLVPYWNAVMPPYWDAAATGITVGWTGAHRREHFYRAILEGIAYEHRLAMDGVAKATGHPLNEFILMGGGSKSALWCQIVADVSGIKTTRASTSEATNLGAGILAAAAAGWYSTVRAAANAMTTTERSFEPSEKTHKIYDRLYREVYVGLFPAVQQYVDRLTELTYDGEEE
jgi:sugar (pentulose or hexulose) kinase